MVKTYRNVYGEDWYFMYDCDKYIGYLQGTDLGEGKTIYVKFGMCPEVIMNEDEKEWLKNAWNECVIECDQQFMKMQ